MAAGRFHADSRFAFPSTTLVLPCLIIHDATSGLARPSALEKRISPAQMRGGMMTKTVLIVEDNELNMKLFHDLSGSARLSDR